VMVSLLNSVLCEQKSDIIVPTARYCVLSLLPLFDFNYFIGLATGGGTTFTVPPLRPVADEETHDRQTAMCESPICVAFVENLASTLLARLPVSDTVVAASAFIRGTVSRMRCGCSGVENPCHSGVVENALIATTNGVRAFADGQGCDANGMVTECARTWITCDDVPPPVCAKPCVKGDIATIKFGITNLDWTCLQTALAGNTMKILRADVIANVKGLLDTDFDCTCEVAVAPAAGTVCTCDVTCKLLNLVKNVDLVSSFGSLKRLATALVIPTPNLDKASTCKVITGDQSFGSSFVVLSTSTNFGTMADNSAAHPLLVGLSVVASLCLSLVL